MKPVEVSLASSTYVASREVAINKREYAPMHEGSHLKQKSSVTDFIILAADSCLL